MQDLSQKVQLDESESTRRRFLCPLCSKHTVLWLLPTKEIKNLPIKCKRCGKETVISVAPMPESE